MGWFERKDGCQYDDQSEYGKKTTEETNLCMSTLRATLPSKKKRLINPNSKKTRTVRRRQERPGERYSSPR